MSTIKTYYDQTLAKQDLAVDQTDLDRELCEAAGKYSYWNSLLVQAEMQLERLENALEIVEAKLDEDVRKAAIASGAGKITESSVKSEIARNPKIAQLKEMIVQARGEMNLLKAQSYALVQRKDALLQLARRRTEEMKGSPVVMGNRSESIRQREEAFKDHW